MSVVIIRRNRITRELRHSKYATAQAEYYQYISWRGYKYKYKYSETI